MNTYLSDENRQLQQALSEIQAQSDLLLKDKEELEGTLSQLNQELQKARTYSRSRESLNDQVLTQILIEKDSYIQKLEEEIN